MQSSTQNDPDRDRPCPGKDLSAALPALDSELSVEERLKQLVGETLDHYPEFSKRLFSHRHPVVARVIDADYREQVTIEAESKAVERYLKYFDPGKGNQEQALRQAMDDAIEYACEHRDGYFRMWEACQGLDIIFTAGATSDTVWNESLERFSRHFAKLAVDNGFCIINGGAETGVMGRLSRYVEEERQRYINEHDDDPVTRVIHVRLRFQNGKTDPSLAATPGYKSPPLISLLSRTEMLYSLGRRGTELLFPGGVGTGEELMRRLASSVMAERGDTTTLHSGTDFPAAVGILNTEVKPGLPHYNGYEKQIEYCQKLDGEEGVREEDVFSDILEDPEGAAAEVIQRALQRRALCDAVEKSETQDDPALVDLLEEFEKRVDCSIELNKRRLNATDPAISRLLNAYHKEEVLIGAEQFVVQRYQKLVENIAPYRAREMAMVAGVEYVNHFADAFTQLWKRCEGVPTVTVFGSVEESVWNEELEQASRSIAREAVARGYSLIVGGDAFKGVGRRVRQIWKEAIADYNTSAEVETESRVIIDEFGVEELHARSKVDDHMSRRYSILSFKDELPETLKGASRPQLSYLAHSPTLLGLGSPKMYLFYPGGVIEQEASARALVEHQMRDLIQTVTTGREEPPLIAYLNTRLPEFPGKFYDPMVEQIEVFKSTGATRPEVFDTVRFVDASDPHSSVNELFSAMF